MALQYEVCQLRSTGYGASANNSGGQKSCQISFTQTFLVKITDPADPDFNGSKVSDVHAAYASGIPIVNYHSWYDPGSNIGMPLAVCKSKKVKRMDANASVFEVECTFQTEAGKQGKEQEVENGNAPAPETPPTDVTDISPVVTRSVVGRDIVLHEAPAYGYDNKPVFGPEAGPAESIQTKYLPCTHFNPDTLNYLDIKNEINQPITRKQSMLQLTVTLFEDTFTDQNLLERCFKVNTETFRGFQPGSTMITAVNAVKQSVQMAAGQQEKYRVTYNMLIDTYTVTYNDGDLFVGHSAAVPMIGKFFRKDVVGGGITRKIKQFAQKGSGLGAVGIVELDGLPASNQMGEIPYIRYDTVEEADFSTFLPNSVINP